MATILEKLFKFALFPRIVPVAIDDTRAIGTSFSIL